MLLFFIFRFEYLISGPKSYRDFRETGPRPFAGSHSRGAKPPCWRAQVALGQDKQRKLLFKIMYAFVCLVPVRLLLSSTAVLYHVNGSGFTFKLLLIPFRYKRHNASVYKHTRQNDPMKVYGPNGQLPS